MTQKDHKDYAIIGLSLKVAGCNTLDDFWHRLIAGESFIKEMSRERWDLMQSTAVMPWGDRDKIQGMFFDDIAAFDRKLFKFSAAACIFSDPRQRMLLESCWSAIEDAGLGVSELKGKKVGVFIANDGFTFGSYFRGTPQEELGYQEFVIPGNSTSFLANRISYLMDLQGPSMVIDSTCSSVYVALHQAGIALERGECDYALVGGVTLFLEPWKSGETTPTSFETEDREIKSFSKDSNGYRSSEGCGALLLQRNASNLNQKHDCYAILTGSGYNSGGKTASFAKPNQGRLATLFRSTLHSAGLSASDIDYIEAHGISSQVGDAVEAAALIDVFGESETLSYVSTIKPNIGHTHASSGLYSLVKAILAFRYGKIPSIKGLAEGGFNQDIPADTKGIRFLTGVQDWEKGSEKRHVLLSSYGFSNVNAAIVIREPDTVPQDKKQYRFSDKTIVCLSAMSKAQLGDQLTSLYQFIKDQQVLQDKGTAQPIAFDELAYTLQLGRDAMPYRWAGLAKDLSDLQALLKATLEGEDNKGGQSEETEQNIFWGDPGEKDQALEKLRANPEDLDKTLVSAFETGDYKRLAHLWALGINIKWAYCYAGQTLKRIHLPVYPFERKKYWISQQQQISKSMESKDKLHPLVHRNTSTISLQRFTSVYVGTESFLLGHQVNGIKCLAGEAHLELARAAGGISLGKKITQVKDVAWLNLIEVIDRPKEAHIRLRPTGVEGELTYEIYSDVEKGELLHSQGKLSSKIFPSPPDIDLPAIRDRLKETVAKKRFYDAFTEKGLTFGKNYQGLVSYFYSDTEALGEIVLPEPEEEGYVISPGVIDNALQTAVGWVMGKENILNLPFSLKEVTAYRDLPSSRLWAYVQKSKNNRKQSSIIKYDIDLVNDKGEVLLNFKDFVFRNLDSGSKARDVKDKSRKKDTTGDQYHHRVQEIKAQKQPANTLETEESQGLRAFSTTYIRKLLAEELKFAEEELELDAPFEKYGIDSMLVNRLTNALEEQFGRLPRTLFFEYQTLREVIDYFLEEHRDKLYELTGFEAETSTGPEPASAEDTRPAENKRENILANSQSPAIAHSQFAESTESEAIAIIGLSGRYPGANNINEFWENLKSGKDAITEIPKDRWDLKDFYDVEKGKTGKSYSKWGGFMKDVDKFDPLFFNISPNEARLMDPQERLFLQTVWECIEDAGYTRAQLNGKVKGKKELTNKTGIYVGVMFQDYALLGPEQSHNENAVPDGIAGNVANRISYFFNFHGPSLVMDTMCSSSLTAIHMACQGLLSGDAQLAIAGGVNVSAHPNKYLMLCQKQFLSAKGKCESFGQDGDGYVPGEGVGAVLLKPLSKAEADGDRIYGIIKGSSVNHGGKTNGYTVPNPNAQAALIRETIEKAGVKAEDFSYIEAHGTGTSLGDPIEITGLTKAFQSEKKQYCAIGSVKSNIGHTESAAGISGVTKVLLQMQHKQLAPSLHSAVLNSHIDFEDTPFRVQQQLSEWTTAGHKPRMAGVSSFGAGGSNAHVILEEYPDQLKIKNGQLKIQHEQLEIKKSEIGIKDEPVLIVLSAKNRERLRVVVKNLLDCITDSTIHNSEFSIHNLSYTLQTGREAMEERLAFTAGTIDEVVHKLNKYQQGNSDSYQQGDVFTGNIREGKKSTALLLSGEEGRDYLKKVIEKRDYEKIGQLWAGGIAIDWNLLYEDQNPALRPRKIGLPTYPFAKERYWLGETSKQIPADASGVSFESPVAFDRSLTSLEEVKQPLETNGQMRELTSEWSNGTLAEGSVYFTPRWEASALSEVPERPSGSTHGITVFIATDDNGIIEKIKAQHIADHNFQLSTSEDIAKQVQDNTLQLLEYCKKRIKNKKNNTEKLLVCVPYKDTEFPYRSLMGMLRSVSLESPSLRTRLVFDHALHSGGVDLLSKHLGDEITFWDDASEVLYDRNQSRLVLRQKQIPSDSFKATGPEIRTEGVYLITGGLGGLGRIFAHFIGKDTGAQVVLTGRSSLSSEKKALLKTLSSEGIRAHYISCDISDKTKTQQMVDDVVGKFGAIHGVIHSAGSIRDNYVVNKTAEETLEVLSPKVRGLLNLDEATGNLPLDFFVVCSSVAAFGSSGQTDYATGNAFMDAFAKHRHDLVTKGMRKGKSVSVNWPLWKDGGMNPGKPYEEAMFKHMGMRPLETALGIEAFMKALACGEQQLGIIWGATQKILTFLNIETAGQNKHTKAQPLTKDAIRNSVLEEVATIIGAGKNNIHYKEPLINYGIDSIGLMKLADVLNTAYRSNYTGAAFLELNTVELIATHLYEHSDLEEVQVHQPVKLPVSVQANGSETYKSQPRQHLNVEKTQEQARDKLAIIGYDCKFPGAETPEAFWEHISNNTIAVKNLKPDDWEKRGVACNGAYERMKWAGLLDDIDRFDAAFWGISRQIAGQMDPQLRLLLQSIWHGIEHAGYAADRFTKQSVGLFVAADANDYASVLRANDQIPGLETDMSVGMLANKVSYYCNFHGPSESIDNACSSVYVALNQAQRAIQYGACDVAVVAGVKLLLDPLGFRIRGQGQLLGTSGNTYSFDKKADGYIRGEGVGCLLLKPLEQAQKDGDTIHGIVSGTGVVHNGNRGLSSLAPSVEAQYSAMATAYEAAGVDPATVHYIEAHGTATDFNDAAEISAYKKFFKASMHEDTYKAHRCAISTTKPNIGHLEAASGIASLIKALLALKHGQIPPVATFSSPHPSLFIENSPFYIPTGVGSWERIKDEKSSEASPRRVSLHAVGIGGVNAHVILEESRVGIPEKTPVKAHKSDRYRLLVISARSKISLEKYGRQWLNYLESIENESEDKTLLLANMAYSSQISREAMSFRQAFVVNDMESLKACLRKVTQGAERSQSNTSYVVSGTNETGAQAPENTQEYSNDGSLGDLSKIADDWVAGRSIDWEGFSGDENLERIAIPNYPFEDERYWCTDIRQEDTFESLFYDTFEA